MESKSFALIGAAGYIAPRHMKAIKDTGNKLVAALDTSDSVGVMDSYFPESKFFVEFERFDRHINKVRRLGEPINYVSVCSPNYLHDAHIRFGLRNHAHVICEKPIVLNPWNIDSIVEIEREFECNVYSVLQLRLHPSLIKLKQQIDAKKSDVIHDVDLTYITSRGNWYYTSWKGGVSKSGGIATNIGVHFFDMLGWIFGELKSNTVHLNEKDRAAGYLEFSKARVRWFLSINAETLPISVKDKNQTTYRSITVDGEEIEFSDGFADLHTRSYEEILNGNGFTVKTAKKSIEIVHNIRNAEKSPLTGDFHPMAKNYG
ncbi:MAG: UDP-N-acetyl-2-amino-2-deoxyglucuronate dehydrogenase [Patiriisocius sp.]|jgi:UDP-N-acetyl-2-amino-2-deoxyglucuronate dehydrogenase